MLQGGKILLSGLPKNEREPALAGSQLSAVNRSTRNSTLSIIAPRDRSVTKGYMADMQYSSFRMTKFVISG